MFTRFSIRRYSTISARTAVLVFALFGWVNCVHADEVISGKFNLTDHHGNAVTEESYNGKFRLVFFGFTDCPLICPTTMVDVAKVMRLLGDRAEQLQPLFISIDTQKDTVDRLAQYVTAFHPAIVGLTGSDQQIDRASKAFNVTFGRTPAADGQGQSEIFHSTYLYLMDGDGQFVDLFGYGTQPHRIVEKLGKFIQG